jgi:hypothetical protein
LDKKEMSFANAQRAGGRTKNVASDSIQIQGDDYGRSSLGYKVDRDDTLNHPWYNIKYWGKKAWIAVVAIVVIIIVIVVVVAVEVTKNNAYPDYTKLNYSLAQNCTSLPFPISPFKILITCQTLEPVSSITSTTLPAMTPPQVSSTTSRKRKPPS